MEHKEFWRRYREAKQQAIQIASSMIIEPLPNIHMPFVGFPMLGPSTDLARDERVFERDDIHRQVGHGHPHEEHQMVEYFWRDGFVPRWIDVRVFSTNGTITVLEFHASDVFTRYDAAGSRIHTERPWAAKSPRSPASWRNVQESGRFSLNWHLRGGA